MLCVVSGQTVVHSESSKASITTLPRNWLSDIGWPNWLTSRKSGAGTPPRELPRSRFGLASAALAAQAAVGDGPANAGWRCRRLGPLSTREDGRSRERAARAERVMAKTAYCGRADGQRGDGLPAGTPCRSVCRAGSRASGRRRAHRRVVADDHRAAVAPGDVPPGQVDQRGDPVPAAQQVHQVQREPGQPGQRAASAAGRRQLDHGRPAADRGHRALVVVLERLGGRPGHPA